jgi:hypothetical protein
VKDADVTRHIYSYEGENELWSAQFLIDCTETWTDKDGTLDYENESDMNLTLNYKGELSDLSSVRHMEISYSTDFISMGSTSDLEEGSIKSKTFTLKSNGKNSALPDKDDIITVTVNLEGDIQTFELRYK